MGTSIFYHSDNSTVNRVHRLKPAFYFMKDIRITLCGRTGFVPADGTALRSVMGSVILSTEDPQETTCIKCARIQP